MKKIKTLLILAVAWICYTDSFSQITPTWATAYTANYPAYIYENDMVTDKTGNVYITGYLNDSTNSPYKIVTLKYDTWGQFQWIQEIDTLNYYTKIAVDNSGNVYVAGQADYNLITVKYNSQGFLKWCKPYYSGVFNWVWDIITDDSCNVYITGISHNNEFTTIKYNSSGNQMWAALDVASNGLDKSYIELDNNKNVYIAFRGSDTNYTCNTIKYNSSGIKQWEMIYKGSLHPGSALPRGLKFDTNGFIYVFAQSYDSNDGEYAVVKYDTSGNQIWASSHHFNSYAVVAKAMAIDKSGNVYATGVINQTGGTIDSIATIKFDRNGVFKWAMKFSNGYYGLDEPSAIIVDSLGYIYVACQSSYSYNENFVTIKYDSLGNEIWVARYNHSLNSSDYANSISLDNVGNIYVSGSNHDNNSSAILTVKYSFDVGINEFDNLKNNAIVYPNPFKTSFTIEVENDLKNAELKIYNILGREVINIKNLKNKEINIQRSDLTNGIYFYSIIEKNKTIAKGKIIAE